MTKSKLTKQLIETLTINPDHDIQTALDQILTPINLHRLNKDQKNKITQLHDFVYTRFDGEAEKTVELFRLVLSVIRSLRPNLPVQYELEFWLNKILSTDRKSFDLQLHLVRAALQAKMSWPTDMNHYWTGTPAIPSYLFLEEHLNTLYGWFHQDLGYDPTDPTDRNRLSKYTIQILVAL